MVNGTMGERAVYKFLMQQGYKIEDVTLQPQYWEKDIDYIVTNPQSGAQAAIEVKCDSRMARTGNFFIETKNPRSQGGKGWLYFCQADFIYYLDSINEILYIFKTYQLKEFIKQNQAYLKTRETNDGAQGYALKVEAAPIYNTIHLQGV